MSASITELANPPLHRRRSPVRFLFAICCALAVTACGGSAERAADGEIKRAVLIGSGKPVFVAVTDSGPKRVALLDGSGTAVATFGVPAEFIDRGRAAAVSVDGCPGGKHWIERWGRGLVVRDVERGTTVSTVPFDSEGIAGTGAVACVSEAGDAWVRGDDSIYNVIENVVIGTPHVVSSQGVSVGWTDLAATSAGVFGVHKPTGLGERPRLEFIDMSRVPLTVAAIDAKELGAGSAGSAGSAGVGGAGGVEQILSDASHTFVAVLLAGDFGSRVVLFRLSPNNVELARTIDRVCADMAFVGQVLRLNCGAGAIEFGLGADGDADADGNSNPTADSDPFDNPNWASTASGSVVGGVVDGSVRVSDPAAKPREGVAHPFGDAHHVVDLVGLDRASG